MRRTASALSAFALCCAVAFSPAGATAGSTDTSAQPVAWAAKKKCKGKHHRSAQRKHCRKKASRDDNGGAGGGGADGGSGTGSQAPCANTPSAPGRAAARESEYAIQLSRPSVGCGTLLLEQDNLGMDPHDLVLQKDGDPAPSYSFGRLDPGLHATQTLNLSRGNWVLYCDVLDHRARGMQVTLTVN
jgi:hypothetical protein